MTLKEMAEELGVSAATVSRVLSGTTKNFTVTDELRRKIVDLADKYGYRPNPVFRNIRKQSVKQIAILSYARSTAGVGYTFDMMVDRAIRIFDEQHIDVTFTFNSSPHATMKYCLPPWRCAGLLIPDCQSVEQLSQIENSGIPYVCINGIAGPNGTGIIVDEQDGMEQIVAHFAALGHRKIAYITAPVQDTGVTYNINKLRSRQFVESAKTHQLYPMLVTVNSGISPEAFIGADIHFFDGSPTIYYEIPDFSAVLIRNGITAVICSNDLVMELLYWAGKQHVAVPEKLSIISYNDMPFMRRTLPPMSAFRIPAEEMGALAAQTLLKKINDPNYKKGETIHLQGMVISRDSTSKAK